MEVSQSHRCRARRVEVAYLAQSKLVCNAVGQAQLQEGKIPSAIIFHKDNSCVESLQA